MCRVKSGAINANARGRTLLDANFDLFNRCFRDASESGTIVQRRADDVQLAFVPLFNEGELVEAVLATSAGVVELPRLLHQIHSATRHFSQILHLLPQIVMTARPGGRIDYASRRWSDVVDVKVQEADIHANFFEALEETRPGEIEARWKDDVASGNEFGFEVRVRTRIGPRWFILRATPWKMHGSIVKWAVSLTDIDPQVHTRASLDRSRKRLQLLAAIGRTLNEATDGAAIAREVVRSLAEWSGGTAIAELRAFGERVAVSSQPQDAVSLVEPITASFARRDAASHDVPGLQTAEIHGRERGTSGFIAVVRGEIFEPEEDRELLEDVASRVATALERALAYNREHYISSVLQRSMLPVALPHVFGLAFDLAYAPADRDISVGGDWYDGFLLGNGNLALTIGDVAGHGLDAAIVMANVRRSIRSAALNDADPAAILAHANIVAYAERCPMVTVFLGILDPITLRLEYANAGHPPPIMLARDASTTALDADGPPLGVSGSLHLKTRTAQLKAGSALVLYTDGVVESRHDIEIGERELHAVLRRWAARKFVDSAVVLQQQVLGDMPNDDDAAMFIVRSLVSDELDRDGVPDRPGLDQSESSAVSQTDFRT